MSKLRSSPTAGNLITSTIPKNYKWKSISQKAETLTPEMPKHHKDITSSSTSTANVSSSEQKKSEPVVSSRNNTLQEKKPSKTVKFQKEIIDALEAAQVYTFPLEESVEVLKYICRTKLCEEPMVLGAVKPIKDTFVANIKMLQSSILKDLYLDREYAEWARVFFVSPDYEKTMELKSSDTC